MGYTVGSEVTECRQLNDMLALADPTLQLTVEKLRL